MSISLITPIYNSQRKLESLMTMDDSSQEDIAIEAYQWFSEKDRSGSEVDDWLAVSDNANKFIMLFSEHDVLIDFINSATAMDNMQASYTASEYFMGNATAMVKWITHVAGDMDPDNWDDLYELAADASGMADVAKSDAAVSVLLKSEFAVDKALANTTAVDELVAEGDTRQAFLDDSYARSVIDDDDDLTEKFHAVGQEEFTDPGDHTFTVPDFCYSISIVAVGGGGAGEYESQEDSDASGGAGGGLGWVNDVSVSPGDKITVMVGKGGEDSGSDGENSNVKVDGSVVVEGEGGEGGRSNEDSLGGSFTGDGGGNGGNGEAGYHGYGGGGAGGYSGNGGDGGGYSGGDGEGGGGGGGARHHFSLAGAGGSGGGVGLKGEGDSGIGADEEEEPGTGGSGGEDGSSPPHSDDDPTTGGEYGGGSASSHETSLEIGPGGNGGVRIIYPGHYRKFPSTNTDDIS